ncbi:hypothetical protein Btru_038227 [Bulinus truncatus]|nr:hypothetical protein Btru_038227 [Bulinus truncatus]
MTEWERYTCVRFRPATTEDKNLIRLQGGGGCNSQLGMIGGTQDLNLEYPGCRFKGLYLHEIGHALGLVHEHQLPNRDDYIGIIYENVLPRMRMWFNKYTTKVVDQMNVPYEYSSVMHYGLTAFSVDGKKRTIGVVKREGEDEIGETHLKELAYTDVYIVNLMYNCSSHCPQPDKCGSEGHLDQNCECICKDGSSNCDKTKSKTAQQQPPQCVNEYNSWKCYIWANQGECERNGAYMTRYCRKACGQCDTQSPNAKSTDFDQETGDDACEPIFMPHRFQPQSGSKLFGACTEIQQKDNAVYLMIHHKRTTVFTDVREDSTVDEVKKILQEILKVDQQNMKLFKENVLMSLGDKPVSSYGLTPSTSVCFSLESLVLTCEE